MAIFLMIILALIAAIWLIAQLRFTGPDLTAFDKEPEPFYDTGEVSSGHKKMVKFLIDHFIPPKGLNMKEGLAYTHKGYELQGRNRTFKSEMREQTAEFDGTQVPGEWTLPEGYDPTKRILYIHGGAFMIGSPISHRPITDNLAQRTGCAVFSIDYRLGPEHARSLGIIDCQAAYQWILENGPDGPAPADKLGMSGDSAGGNLIIMLAHWARDKGLRAADALYAMAPGLDITGSGPSMRGNLQTDVVLKRGLGPVVKLPKPLGKWAMFIIGKINPASPIASPVFDSVHDLPPTLIQVSNTEMLYSDSVRYWNKAKAAGSPVDLQVWAKQIHIFQHYDEIIPEAHMALDEGGKFFKSHGVTAKGWKAKVKAV